MVSLLNSKFVIGIILIILMLLSGCIENQPTQEQTGKLSVVTTLYPLYEFAKEVGGDKIEVTLLLPPGAEAHTFEPRPSDIIKINKSQLFIYIGAGMEPWAEDIIQGIENKKLLLLDSSKKVTLISSHEEEHEHEEHPEETHEHEEVETHEHKLETTEETHEHEENLEEHLEEEHEYKHGEYDPHIWLDFSNDEKIVLAIAEELSKIDSNNKEFYYANANAYNLKLKELDANYSIALANCKHSEFISGGHNAFGYLAHKYNLESISAFGISPNSEPTPQSIKKIIDLTKEHKIKYIYFEKLINPKIAETIATEAKATTLVLNPAHNLQKEQFDLRVSFISLMQENLTSLKIGLECN